MKRNTVLRSGPFLAIALACALGLAACNETGLQASVERSAAKARIAANPGVSPAGASVAFVSLAGAPNAIRKKLGDEMTLALARQNVRLATTEKADYLVRGHLTSFAAGRATRVAFIWDIFGADKSRRQRLDDDLILKTSAADPWSLGLWRRHCQDRSQQQPGYCGFLVAHPGGDRSSQNNGQQSRQAKDFQSERGATGQASGSGQSIADLELRVGAVKPFDPRSSACSASPIAFAAQANPAAVAIAVDGTLAATTYCNCHIV